jgi:hypothetical protein
VSLSAADFVTRPIQELFGRHPGYGFAGVGVMVREMSTVRPTAG